VRECPFGVAGVEPGQRIDDKAESTKLGLLPGSVCLVEVPAAPVEDASG
jgi:hypothetical protein